MNENAAIPEATLPGEQNPQETPVENISMPENEDLTINSPQPAEAQRTEPKRTRAPRWRTPLLVVLIFVAVLLLGAGGGLAYLRSTETRLLDEAQAAINKGEWSIAESSCSQLFNLPANFLEDPQRCLPLRGEAYFQSGKFEQALADLQATQSRYPDSARPYFLVTQIYLSQGKMTEALSAAAEAQKRDDTLALPYTLQAEEAYRQGKLKEAEKAAGEALKRDGKQQPALRILGNMQAWRGEFKAAMQNLNAAIELDSKDVQALTDRAILNFILDHFKAFQADAEIVLAQGDSSTQALVLKALQSSLDYDPHKSFEYINAAIKQDGTRSEYYYLRAMLYPTEEKALKGQIPDLDKALELNPELYAAQAMRLTTLANRYENIELLNEGLRLQKAVPETGWGEYLITLHYYLHREWDSAVEWANKYIQNNPELSHSYILHGRISAEWGLGKTGQDDFNKALELNPKSLEARSQLAYLKFLRGETEESLKLLDEIVELAPKLADPYIQRAMTYLFQDKDDKARLDVDKALEIDPQSTEALSTRFLLDVKAKDYTKAAEYAALIASLYPKSPVSHFLKSTLYLTQNDAQRSLDEAKLAIDAYKYDVSLYFQAASASFQLKKYDEVLAYTAEALKIQPKSKDALALNANAYFMKRDYDQTITYGLKAVDIDPKLASVYMIMAAASIANDDYTMARNYLISAQAHANKLPIDAVQLNEKNIKFFATIPPLVDGIRTVVDKDNKFSFSYSKNWVPSPDIKPDNKEVLRITSKDADPVIVSVFVFPITGQYTTYYTAQMFADYFRQEVVPNGTKYTDRKPVQGAEYGIMDAYEVTAKDKTGKSVTYHGRSYFFYQTGRLVMMDIYGPANIFDQTTAEIEKVVKTLKFIK